MPSIPNPTATITEHFANLKDPRVNRTKRHLLTDILTITLCAVICGADSWTEIEDFGLCKEQWFKTFLSLPHGIPSHDTFGRVFAALDSEAFSTCFTQWIDAVCKVSHGSLVAIDGKTLRRSFDRGSRQAAIHMVSAWVENNQLVWGQVKTEEKSNEITAIPKLLEMLMLEGCIVTIDAMGCQKKIAAAIIEKGADYVLSLKGNQSTMAEEVQLFFDGALETNWRDIPHDTYQTINKDHGRIETRRYAVTPEVAWFADLKEWKGLKSFGLVVSERQTRDGATSEYRFYISSLPGLDAKAFAQAVRGHWGVENKLHWTLDMAFREDESRVRKDHAAANLSIFRRIALNLLKQENTKKRGINGKRKNCGWDENYLLKVIGIL